jgi:hypothetical protein
MHLPFMQTILATGPVRFTQWLTILALALVILVVMEVFKSIKRQSDE